MPLHTNRLVHETSPYLLQHAHNPVDWYPWGPEALERARSEDLPILLSIGYAACHWCHVMAHESFEDEATAALMNAHYVNVKVDREERPDLDAVYMAAVQALTGHGGWPMTVFLTPDGRPFFGGTYFPPTDRRGQIGFPRLLVALAEAWRGRRAEVEVGAQALVARLGPLLAAAAAPDRELDATVLTFAEQHLEQIHDPLHGGFGRAPKFPPAMALEFLLRRLDRPAVAAMVDLTLTRMAEGGMYDQLGGGFHRYSTDEQWLVPHFEKMLYDNALLARTYLFAYQATGNALYRRVCEETLDYLGREMTSDDGAFFASQDADSEGEEGRFFVWSRSEIMQVLGDNAGLLFCAACGVTDEGNFEHGTNVLHVARSGRSVAEEFGLEPGYVAEVLGQARLVLFAHRERRVKPGRDEKAIASWNGLALSAFARASRVLDRQDYRRVAEASGEFLAGKLWEPREGRLYRVFKDGIRKVPGFLEDHACVAEGLLALYEATFDSRWFRAAREVVEALMARFWDEGAGAFEDSGPDHEHLIARPRDLFDNATPAGNSVAADVLLRLATYLGPQGGTMRERAVRAIAQVQPLAARYPSGFGRLLCALDFGLSRPHEVVIVGDPTTEATRALLGVTFGPYRPYQVVAGIAPGERADGLPLLEGREASGGESRAYVCRDFACHAPVDSAEALEAALAG